MNVKAFSFPLLASSVLLSFFTLGCGGGDNAASVPRSEMVGCWHLDRALIGTPQGKLPVTEEYPDYYIFKDNGFVLQQMRDGTQNTTVWEVDEGGTVFRLPGADFMVQQYDSTYLEISDSGVTVPSGIEGRLELLLSKSSTCRPEQEEPHLITATISSGEDVPFESHDASALYSGRTSWSVVGFQADTFDEVTTISIRREGGAYEIAHSTSNLESGRTMEYELANVQVNSVESEDSVTGTFSYVATHSSNLRRLMNVSGSFRLLKARSE